MSSTSSAHSPPSPTASAHDESPSQTPESPVPLPPPQTEAVQNSPQKTVVVPDTMIAVPGTQPKPEGSRTQLKTPEPLHLKEPMNGQNGQNGQNGHKEAGADRSPSTPGHLAPFDWDEFEARYEAALADADRHEQELLREFDDLVKVSRFSGRPRRSCLTPFRSSSMSGPLPPRPTTRSAGSRGSRPESDTSASRSRVCCRRRNTVSLGYFFGV